MKRLPRTHRPITSGVSLALLVGLTALAGGCQSTPQADTEAKAQEITRRQAQAQEARRAYGRAIRQTTDALNEGDVEAAREHLSSAKEHLKYLGAQELRQVRSLDLLIQGHEAYLAGDLDRVAEAWLAIPDERLREQVIERARLDLQIQLSQ
jgi:hypothetical protein